MSPKDRLRDLQLHAPELFQHVSIKGLKRLIAQVQNARDLGSGSDRRAFRVAPTSRFPVGLGSQKRFGNFERKQATG